MTIYHYGCRCGPVGKQIQAVKNMYPDTEVKNSKYDKEALAAHMDYLIEFNLNTDSYPAVVVDGETVTLLRAWSN